MPGPPETPYPKPKRIHSANALELVFRNYDAQVYNLVCQRGWTWDRAAKEIGISPKQIGNILRKINTRFIELHGNFVEGHRMKVIARAEHVFTEAMDEWEKSKNRSEAKDRVRQESYPDPGKPADGEEADGAKTKSGKTVAERTTVSKLGDPRYLAQALAANTQIREILGLDAAQKHDVSMSGGVEINLAQPVPFEKQDLEGQQQVLAAVLTELKKLGLEPADLERTGDGDDSDESTVDAEYRSVESPGQSAENPNLPVLASPAHP